MPELKLREFASAILLGVVLAWLAAAWVAVECVHDLHVTMFQPFRMATLARGLALVLVAGRVVDLWLRGGVYHRLRAVLIAVGLIGDWMFVVVATAELGATLGERLSDRCGASPLRDDPRIRSLLLVTA